MKPSLPRRNFLQLTGAALAAGLSWTVLAADAPKKKRALKKAIMWGTVGVKGSVLEKMKLVKEAGFEGVEPNGGMDQDEVMRALEATGLQAASVCCHTHWAKPLSSPVPAVREAGLEGLRISLRDAKRYGAGSVLLVPGVARDGVSYEECWQRSIVEIRKVIPLAEELQVVIAIENVWNDFITREDEAVRYLDEINSPWVKWHFDVGNIIWYGDPIDWIKKLGPRIARLHIKEYSRDLAMKAGKWAGFNAKFLEGANNWAGIMKALDEVGYTGWGIAEQGGGGTLEGLKDLSTRMDKIFAS
ncbi:MAG TPA: sugar phosphate isomerase/epimerase family protein [Methylomirabilota bacterium]|nr:sugar phosphate isomerase/epimerase family protein [Methylomirabilota bacterium]